MVCRKNIADIKVDGIFVTEVSDQSIVTHELRIKSVSTFRSKCEEMISECNEWFVSKAVHHVRLFVLDLDDGLALGCIEGLS